MEEIKQHPLILVFYLDKEMMMNPEIIRPFSESVNALIEHKKANIICFFIPAAEGTPERIEAINPTMLNEVDMVKVNKIIEDIQKNFMVDIDVPDEEIILDEKPCQCDNGEGTCNCITKL